MKVRKELHLRKKDPSRNGIIRKGHEHPWKFARNCICGKKDITQWHHAMDVDFTPRLIAESSKRSRHDVRVSWWTLSLYTHDRVSFCLTDGRIFVQNYTGKGKVGERPYRGIIQKKLDRLSLWTLSLWTLQLLWISLEGAAATRARLQQGRGCNKGAHEH